MNIDDVRKLSDQELTSKIYELKENLLYLRFQAKSGQLDNGKKITQVRKDIARCMTVESERKHAKEEQEA